MKYTPSPISIAVSTTSQLSVAIVATESVYCDNVQCGNMYNETKSQLKCIFKWLGQLPCFHVAAWLYKYDFNGTIAS